MEKLTIPPEFSTYAEEKGIFTLLESMLQELIVARPDEPLQFLDEYLSRDKDKSKYTSTYDHVATCVCIYKLCTHISNTAPRVIVYGPPCSGKYSLVRVVLIV